MKKKFDITFVCNKCGKPQIKDDKLSNKNWNVYKNNEKCECGGTFEMKVTSNI